MPSASNVYRIYEDEYGFDLNEVADSIKVLFFTNVVSLRDKEMFIYLLNDKDVGG